MKKINLNLNLQINKFAHTADIHIRTIIRHQEYVDVFKKFFKSIVNQKVDALFILGDTVHSKTQLSPELVNILSSFLITADQICPTFYIPGNHDVNLTNLERKDVIGSLFSILDLTQSYYLKDTAIYRLKNIDLYNYSLFDQINKFDNKIIDKNKKNIALYHGVIDGSKNEFNFEFKSDINKEFFKEFDILLLGDIHKRQEMSKENPVSFYPGSLIQQNFGEELNKGYLIWNIKNQISTEFVEVQNDYSFNKIYTENGELPEIDVQSKYPRFMIYLDPIACTKKDELYAILKTKYPTANEINFNELDFSENTELEIEENTDYYDVNIQNKLIYDYLHEKHPYLDGDELEGILKINQFTEDELKQKSYYENPNNGSKWQIKKLSFSNMFKYGMNNFIDFSTIDGMTSITGKNAIGKTSLLEAIIFALYGRTRKDLNTIDIINSQEKNAETIIDLNIVGIPYRIIRTINATTSRKDNIRTASATVQLECLDINQEDHNQNDVDKKTTDKKIASLIGSFDDFIELNVMSQNNWLSFITNTDTKQKDTLVSILGLKTFEEKQKVAKQLNSDLKAILKDLQKSDHKAELGSLDQKLKFLKLKEEEIQKELVQLDREKSIKQKEINQKQSLLKKIDNEEEINVEKIKQEIENTKQEILSLSDDEKFFNEKIKELEGMLPVIKSKIENSNLTEKIKIKKDEIETISTRINLNDRKLSSNNTSLMINQKNVKILIDEPWHEEEDICKKCNFLTNAFNSKDEIENIQNEINILEDEIKKDNDKKTQLKSELSKFEKDLNELLDIKNTLSDKLNTTNSNLIKTINSIKSKSEYTQNLQNSLESYLNNKDNILFNKTLNQEISTLETHYKNIISNYNDKNNIYIEIKGDTREYTTKKETTLENLKKMRETESQYKLYEYYMEATHRNGVPAQIIKKSLNVINVEINKMLNTIVGFSLKLELLDDNLKLYIIHEDEKLTIKGSSGMESIISELVMRIALLKISSKPKTNMLAIDEGFLALDEDTRASLPNLFSLIRKHFKYIFIITHEQSFRDYMDKSIEIISDEKYSYVKTVEISAGGE